MELVLLTAVILTLGPSLMEANNHFPDLTCYESYQRPGMEPLEKACHKKIGNPLNRNCYKACMLERFLIITQPDIFETNDTNYEIMTLEDHYLEEFKNVLDKREEVTEVAGNIVQCKDIMHKIINVERKNCEDWEPIFDCISGYLCSQEKFFPDMSCHDDFKSFPLHREKNLCLKRTSLPTTHDCLKGCILQQLGLYVYDMDEPNPSPRMGKMEGEYFYYNILTHFIDILSGNRDLAEELLKNVNSRCNQTFTKVIQEEKKSCTEWDELYDCIEKELSCYEVTAASVAATANPNAEKTDPPPRKSPMQAGRSFSDDFIDPTLDDSAIEVEVPTVVTTTEEPTTVPPPDTPPTPVPDTKGHCGAMVTPDGFCSKHTNSLCSCRKAGCQTSIAKNGCVPTKPCETWFSQCPNAIGPAQCLRSGAYYVHGGILCKNKKNLGHCNIKETLLGVKMAVMAGITIKDSRNVVYSHEDKYDDPEESRLIGENLASCKGDWPTIPKDDAQLYQTMVVGRKEAHGCLSYHIPLMKDVGRYEISIKFLETAVTSVSNPRSFSVKIGQTVLLSELDVFKHVGHCEPMEVIIPVVVTNGGEKIVIQGYDALPNDEANVGTLSFCYGECFRGDGADGSYIVSAFYVAKIGAA